MPPVEIIDRDSRGCIIEATNNPGGKSFPALSWAETLRYKLMSLKPDGTRRIDAAVEAFVRQAEDGSIEAAKVIAERLDGKVKDVLELQGSLSLTAEEVRLVEVSITSQLAAIYQKLHLQAPVDTTCRELPANSTVSLDNAAQIEPHDDSQPDTQPVSATTNVQAPARARDGAPPRGLTRDQRLDWWAGIQHQHDAEAQP